MRLAVRSWPCASYTTSSTRPAPIDCAAPPPSWPSTIVGLIVRPRSWTIARVRQAAPPAGPHAEREERRVAGAHDHVIERGAELGRGDLGERGRVTLALRRDPDEDVHLAARVHAHRRALVGAEPGALRVARKAQAEAA